MLRCDPLIKLKEKLVKMENKPYSENAEHGYRSWENEELYD